MIDADELVGVVFSGLPALVIDDVEDAGSMICIRARTRGDAVSCPDCGQETGRVHGYHKRTAADAAVDGRPVLVKVKARRRRCPVVGCPRQTFRGQVPGVPERYQRRTARLSGQVSAAVRGLAGRAGLGFTGPRAEAEEIKRGQDRTRRQEAAGRTVRRNSPAAAEGRGHH